MNGGSLPWAAGAQSARAPADAIARRPTFSIMSLAGDEGLAGLLAAFDWALSRVRGIVAPAATSRSRSSERKAGSENGGLVASHWK